MLADNANLAKVIGKGVTFEKVDDKEVQSFNVGQHIGIIVPEGTHILSVVGNIVEYSGWNGKNVTYKSTPTTKVQIDVVAKQTYDLTFSEEEGFQFTKAKKNL